MLAGGIRMGFQDFYHNVKTRWAVQAARDAVPAVDSPGLARLLDKADLRRKFERGELKCKFCRTPVDDETMYALLRESGSVKAVCKRPDCVAQFVAWIESRQP
jgi:hypothetical protein